MKFDGIIDDNNENSITIVTCGDYDNKLNNKSSSRG